MSLFSRFFRQAPPPPLVPEKAPERADAALTEQRMADRAAAAKEVAKKAADEEQALAAAIEAQDVQAVGRLVLEGSSTKIRQQAAQAVEDPAQLRRLIKDVRGGNDKSVYKILTRKRDAQLAQERHLEQLQAEVTVVSTAIERHSHRPYDPVYTPSLEQLQVRWKAIEGDASPEMLQKVQAAIDRSREVIAKHLREIAVEASRQLAAENAAAEAQRLREIEAKATAAAAAERAGLLEVERKAQREQQEVVANALRQLGGLLRKAHGALNEGSTGRAAGLRRTIEEKLPTAPPLPAYLANQLQQLDAKLAELKDWKSFSVAPKRVELMEEMESLIDATLEPPKLAERIKSLQEEWRTLSKGAGENVEADWQRFQDAAQKAYQPCREYFEAQSLVRQENLQRRQALLERLAAFEAGHNWEQPDWRTVITALRESRQEWRGHVPVDRAAGRALQEKFDAVHASLQGRLDAEYARNVKEKKSIVERTQRLVASEDSRKAIETAKELQLEWRAVGPVPRDEDQRLWEEFRLHCDAVFKKRQQEFTEQNAALETNKSQAVGLCEELDKIAVLPGEELVAASARIPELRTAFDAIGELPKADARGLHNRFERVLERIDRAITRYEAGAAERSWTDLLEAANRVRAYRLSVARNADSAERDALRQDAETYLAGVPQWPRGGLDVLKKELAKDTGGDLAAHEASLRKLCIRAEILTDTATPTEDQGLRRQYQMERLVQGMGQGVSTDEVELDVMTFDWIRVGPIEEAIYVALLERFKRCRQRWQR